MPYKNSSNWVSAIYNEDFEQILIKLENDIQLAEREYGYLKIVNFFSLIHFGIEVFQEIRLTGKTSRSIRRKLFGLAVTFSLRLMFMIATTAQIPTRHFTLFFNRVVLSKAGGALTVMLFPSYNVQTAFLSLKEHFITEECYKHSFMEVIPKCYSLYNCIVRKSWTQETKIFAFQTAMKELSEIATYCWPVDIKVTKDTVEIILPKIKLVINPVKRQTYWMSECNGKRIEMFTAYNLELVRGLL